MRRAIYLAAMLAPMAFTPGASAQNSPSYSVSGMESLNSKMTTVVVADPGATCPVGMRALQGTGQGLIRIRGKETEPREAQSPNVPAQRIHLIIADQKRGTIQSGRLVVRGLSAKNRMRNISGPGASPDLSKAMTVTFQAEDATSVSADLQLPGFTSVSSVELQSITYGDGSIWSVARGAACRVTPDPLMLVAEH